MLELSTTAEADARLADAQQRADSLQETAAQATAVAQQAVERQQELQDALLAAHARHRDDEIELQRLRTQVLRGQQLRQDLVAQEAVRDAELTRARSMMREAIAALVQAKKEFAQQRAQTAAVNPSSAVTAAPAITPATAVTDPAIESARLHALELQVQQQAALLTELEQENVAWQTRLQQAQAELANKDSVIRAMQAQLQAAAATHADPHADKQRAERPLRDDLTLICGIGPTLRRVLYKQGVFRFEQIARWSRDDIERIDASLPGFHGRILRDQWVRGAKRWHRKIYGEKL